MKKAMIVDRGQLCEDCNNIVLNMVVIRQADVKASRQAREKRTIEKIKIFRDSGIIYFYLEDCGYASACRSLAAMPVSQLFDGVPNRMRRLAIERCHWEIAVSKKTQWFSALE